MRAILVFCSCISTSDVISWTVPFTVSFPTPFNFFSLELIDSLQFFVAILSWWLSKPTFFLDQRESLMLSSYLSCILPYTPEILYQVYSFLSSYQPIFSTFLILKAFFMFSFTLTQHKRWFGSLKHKFIVWYKLISPSALIVQRLPIPGFNLISVQAK